MNFVPKQCFQADFFIGMLKCNEMQMAVVRSKINLFGVLCNG